MAFCSACGTQMADNAAFCPKCGKATAQAGAAGTAPAPPPPPDSYGTTAGPAMPMAENVAGMLAYFTIIPAIIFLVLEPYNRSRFIRFHAFQSIFFAVAWTALWIVLNIIAHIPLFGWLTILIWPLVGLAGFVIWIVLLLKANQGQMWKLPVIGDIAEKQANA